jgi:hypothetical protein
MATPWAIVTLSEMASSPWFEVMITPDVGGVSVEVLRARFPEMQLLTA